MSSSKAKAPKYKAKQQLRPADLETPVPFPSRLLPPIKDDLQREVLRIFSSVSINIPLLSAIRQIPQYAKVLKELCTVKRTHKVKQHALLTEHVSAIVQKNVPPKFKDPGSPTITCTIGKTTLENALLDLGSSVNLMPHTVFSSLELGQLKRTPVVLQFADRSQKFPRGIIEDVLVQVSDFYFPTDFLVLDILGPKTSIPTPIILGRPFLATCDAKINCRNGQMTITFGNKKMELNVFHALPHHVESVEPREVGMPKPCVEQGDSHLEDQVEPNIIHASCYVDDFIVSLDSNSFVHTNVDDFVVVPQLDEDL